MKILLGICFVFIIISILLFFKIDVQTIQNSIKMTRPKSLRSYTIQKRPSKLAVFTKSVYTALNATGQINRLYYLLLVSFLLIVIGVFSGISFGNFYLALVLGVALAAIPFIYVRIQYIEYKSLLLDEMETGLSVITSSYERSENISFAFKENVDNINEPLKSVFSQFIYALDHNVNIATAIDMMKEKINHPIFLEWCDNLKRCSESRSLKASLRPVVDRITDLKVATVEAKNILFEAHNEFKSVTVISLIFVGLTYFVIPKAFNMSGKIPFIDLYLAIDILMIFFFSFRALLLTKDVNFDL